MLTARSVVRSSARTEAHYSGDEPPKASGKQISFFCIDAATGKEATETSSTQSRQFYQSIPNHRDLAVIERAISSHHQAAAVFFSDNASFRYQDKRETFKLRSNVNDVNRNWYESRQSIPATWWRRHLWQNLPTGLIGIRITHYAVLQRGDVVWVKHLGHNGIPQWHPAMLLERHQDDSFTVATLQTKHGSGIPWGQGYTHVGIWGLDAISPYSWDPEVCPHPPLFVYNTHGACLSEYVHTPILENVESIGRKHRLLFV